MVTNMRCKRIICIIFVFSLMSCITACSKNAVNNVETGDKSKMVLSDRQIEILEREELPTNYEELSKTQKNAIVAIEDMLSHLENKYSDKFIYVEYVSSNDIEGEHMTAYSEQLGSSYPITVYRNYENGEFNYSDNYNSIICMFDYQLELEQYCKSTLKENSYKVYVEVTNVEESYEGVNPIENGAAQIYIFLDSGVIAESEFSKFVDDFSTMLKDASKNSKASSTLFMMINSEDIKKINKYNYSNEIYNITIKDKKVCNLSGTGKLTIR